MEETSPRDSQDGVGQLTSFPKSKIKVLLLEGINAGESGVDKEAQVSACVWVCRTDTHDAAAAERFRADGYTVEELKSALPKDELIAKLKDVYILGIRSATDVTKEGASSGGIFRCLLVTDLRSAPVLQASKRLLAIGCFCIGAGMTGAVLSCCGCSTDDVLCCAGTNQVDLDSARSLGIPVFNSPFSNSRSVSAPLSSNRPQTQTHTRTF